LNEYRKYVEKDAALERRFQPIYVDEPSVEDTIEILKGLRDRYEAHHRIMIIDEALVAAARLSHRYISDRYLPDKAIDLIDEAASRVKIQMMTAPSNFKEIEEEIRQVRQEKESSIESQEFEKAAKLRDKEKKLIDEKRKIETEWRVPRDDIQAKVSENEVAEVLSSWTGIPVVRLTEEESSKLMRMEEELHKRIIGQDDAVKAVSRAIRRSRSGLKDPKRPTGSFIFLGPSGVGKTELARTLAEYLFGDEDTLIQLDMSEYMEKHTISRLIGSPPGYIGFEEGGQLTEMVRRKPFSVILFDEVEKAHQDVFNVLLQILEDGHLTDAQGHKVDFRNTIVIMTSNLGARDIQKSTPLGFKKSDGESIDFTKMKSLIMDELKRTFRPEFINRIDDIIIFHQLTDDDVYKIIDLLMKRVADRLDERKISVVLSERMKKHLLSEGYEVTLGARPMRRAIQKLIEDPLSEEILTGNIKDGDMVEADYTDKEVVIHTKEKVSTK
jgi:ATP-dependent Clp protease ATP-binding subunit ClpC